MISTDVFGGRIDLDAWARELDDLGAHLISRDALNLAHPSGSPPCTDQQVASLLAREALIALEFGAILGALRDSPRPVVVDLIPDADRVSRTLEAMLGPVDFRRAGVDEPFPALTPTLTLIVRAVDQERSEQIGSSVEAAFQAGSRFLYTLSSPDWLAGQREAIEQYFWPHQVPFGSGAHLRFVHLSQRRPSQLAKKGSRRSPWRPIRHVIWWRRLVAR